MKSHPRLRPLIVGICLATLQMSGPAQAASTAGTADASAAAANAAATDTTQAAAHGTAARTVAATSVAAAPAPTPTAASIGQRPTTDWISVEDTRFTPVADEVSRHLHAAWQAFDAKDNTKAAAELKTVSATLRQQISGLQHQGNGGSTRNERLRSAMTAVDKAAADIGAGRLHTRAEFDRAFDKAFLADLDSRWIETDTTTWYPTVEEPQQHFSAALAAYADKDYASAATEIRKADAFIRLEAARASAGARTRLDRTVLDLDTLANAAAAGTVKDTRSMTRVFARAQSTLALSHRTKAGESWAAKQYHRAGYELKAAAHGLESAAAWTGDAARTG